MWTKKKKTRSGSMWQGYVFRHVCDSVHGGGVSASVHAGIPPSGSRPPRSRPPRADTPQAQTFPQSRPPPGADTPNPQCMLGDMGNKRAVCILLECILVSSLKWCYIFLIYVFALEIKVLLQRSFTLSVWQSRCFSKWKDFRPVRWNGRIGQNHPCMNMIQL